jgi:hypothetical protein
VGAAGERFVDTPAEGIVLEAHGATAARQRDALQSVLKVPEILCCAGRVHLRRGVPVGVILGHSDLETTLNIYMHAIPDSQRRAVERVAGVLFPDVPKLASGPTELGD